MKRIVSLLLAFAMLISFIPIVLAEKSETITYNFLSTAIDGSNKVSSTTATYENTAAHGSAPWQYVNTVTPNNNTAYNYELCYNWYGTETYKTPEQGDGGIVLKLKVEKGGWYSAMLNHMAQKTSVNAKVFLLPVSTGLDFTSTSSLKDSIKSIPEEYYLGYADGYAAKRAVKTTALKYKYIAEGEYYLVIAPHGVNESYKESDALQSNGKYLYVFSLYSFVLDSTYKPSIEASVACGAMNVGESIKADVTVTDGGVETGDTPVFESLNPDVAEIGSDGTVTAKKEGNARFTAAVGETETEFSVAVVNPEREYYEYKTGGRVLPANDAVAQGGKGAFPESYSDIDMSCSMPWRYVGGKNSVVTLYCADPTESKQYYYGIMDAYVNGAENTNDSFFAYSVYVPKAGVYQLDVRRRKYAGNKADIYFAPMSEIGESDTVPSESGAIKASDLVGSLDFTNANEADFATVGNLAAQRAGEYLLVIKPTDAGTVTSYGRVNFNHLGFKLTPKNSTTLSVELPCDVVNIGETLKVDVKIRNMGLPISAAPEFKALTPEIASIDENGTIDGRSEGTARFEASYDGISEEFVVAVVDSEKTVYEYYIGGRAVLGTDNYTQGQLTTPPSKLSGVRPEISTPWTSVFNKNVSQFQIYYAATPASFIGVTLSSVVRESIGNSFFAYSVYIPKPGYYGFEVMKRSNTQGGRADFYFADAAKLGIGDMVPSQSGPVKEENYIGTLDFSGTINNIDTIEPVGVIYAPKAGEYLLVINPVDANGNTRPVFNYLGFRMDSENALRTLELSGYNTELTYLEETQITAVAKRLDGYVFDENEVEISFSSSNEDIVSVSNEGCLRATGDGVAVITVIATDGTKTIKKEITVTSTDNTDTLGCEIAIDDSLFVREKSVINLFVLKKSGNKISIPSDSVTYTAEPSDAVTIADGMLTAEKEGSVKISASASFRGEVLSAEKEIAITLHEGKTEPTFYTYEKRQNAAENVKKFSWAKAQMDLYTKAADKVVDNIDVIYDNIPGEGVPRGRQVGAPNDPEYNICRYCGEDIVAKYGGTGWKIDRIKRPWKVQCPSCKRIFPSNKFEEFYKLGLDKQGYFNIDRAYEAHKALFAEEYESSGGKLQGYGYLKNDFYPEIEMSNLDPHRKDENGNYYVVDGTNWGVDDGFGYLPGRVYKIGGKEIEERHGYVAMYNYDAWGEFWTDIRNLSLAYVYSGDLKYGRTGAILLDRVADVFGSFNIKPYEKMFFNTHGGSGNGAIQGRINDCDIARFFALGTDAFYPALTDSTVIRYLSEKAEKFGLENKKLTSQDIWENWEEGILKTIFTMEKDGRIHGNFGQKQYALAAAAVSLNKEPESSEMLDWIYQSGSISSAGADGGNLASELIDVVDRDGMGNEASPRYNYTWINNMMGMADVMAAYKGEKEYNPYTHPKFAKMYDAVTRVVLAESQHAQIGDAGATASNTYNGTSDDMMLTGLLNLKGTPYAKPIAQYLYMKNGYSAEGLSYGILEKDPESAESDILALAEENPEPVSEMLTGYGFAILRDGKNYRSSSSATANNNLRDFWIYFGRNRASHAHHDALNLGMEAYGLNIAPDLGYPENTGTQPQRLQWVQATISHNTVTVDEADQSGNLLHGTPLHFDVTDKVKLMDIDAKKANPQTENFRRTLVMVKVNDDISYGVDFFRVTGGKAHTYSFHSQAENATAVEGLNMVPQVDGDGNYVGSYAGADVAYGQDPDTQPDAWSYETKYPRGYTWMKNVRRDTSPQSSSFAVEFDVEDYRKAVSDGNSITLRMTQMNNFVPDEVAITAGTVPNKSENKMMPETLDYVLVQRRSESEDLDSLFTTVFEPYRGERYISSIEPLTVEGNVTGKNMVRAVKVTHTGGERIDYIVYATDNTQVYTVKDDGEDVFDFRGFVGVYSVNSKGVELYHYVNDGDIIGSSSEERKSYSGTVHGFQKSLSSDNYIDVDMECDDLSELAGKYIFVNNDGVQNAVYKIVSATRDPNEAEGLDDGKIRLNIGTITLIREHKNIKNIDLGYVYNIKENQSFEIPTSYLEDFAPLILPISSSLSVNAESSIEFNVNAESPIEGSVLHYLGTTLPSGASIESETGKIMWKPTASQIGENHFAVTVCDDDGREATAHFTVKVYGATTQGGGGGAGGGGGGGTPTPTPEPEPTPNPEPTPGEDNGGFVDIDNYAWAKDSINALAKDGVIKGTGEDTFSPSSNITRADFAILLVRAFKLTGEGKENFADVDASDYFAHELAIAKENGIVGGIGDNKYAPKNTIMREDMMVIVYRALTALGMIDETNAERNDTQVVPYGDFDSVADYAKGAVSYLIANGLVNGKNGLIDPKAYTTRAEVAVLVKRILDFIAK